VHRVAAILAIFLMSALAAGQSRAEPFVIGIGLGLTGPGAAMATDHRDGLLLWVDDVNAHGGVLNKTVDLAVIDHGGDPQRAAAVYDQWAAGDDVDWLLAPSDDDAALAAAEAASRHGRPLLAGGATADALWKDGEGRVLGVLAPASGQMTDFLAMLVLAGADRLALVGAEGAYAEAAYQGTLTWARRFGMDVVLSERPVRGGWDAVAERARRAGAQAVAVCGQARDAEAAVLALRHAHWRPMAVMVTMGTGDDFGLRLGQATEGVFTVSAWEYDPGLRDVSDFETRFQHRFGRRPTFMAASAYATGEVLAHAALRAGSTDREALYQALLSLDVMTVVGRFALEADGRQARQTPVVIQWQHGRRNVVWPPAFAKTQPVFAQ